MFTNDVESPTTGCLLVTLVMVVSVVMMFVMGTFKEKHLDGNYTGTVTPLRGYTSQGDHTVTQHFINTAFLSDSAVYCLCFL